VDIKTNFIENEVCFEHFFGESQFL